MKKKDKAITLMDKSLSLKNGRYLVKVKVLQVMKGTKYPNGIKAKYVLLNLEKMEIRLLVDNHSPWGYHLHPELPENHEVRVRLGVKDYKKAEEFFFKEVEKVLKNEK